VFNSVADESVNAVGGRDSGASVSMIETRPPAAVVNEAEMSKALTYIYGLMSLGESDTGTDDSKASVNIGRVSLTTGAFVCDIAVSGYDGGVVSGIVGEQVALERLSGIPARMTHVISGYGAMDAAGLNGADDADDDTPEEVDEELDALSAAYREVTGGDASPVTSGVPGPLGAASGGAKVMGIGVTVRDEGTTGEYFTKKEMAIPANVILRYLERRLAQESAG
jgi:hypothetical protein